ncbi:MAG: glycosyltransferase [Bacteroidota bacterium]|nr:glycosyltransferase [Bacteroidota bacterium]
MVFVTFVLPTIGRPSLLSAVASLQSQTNPDWNAIVVFDGTRPTDDVQAALDADDRFTVECIAKTGSSASGGTTNRAGAVRNVALDAVASLSDVPKWVAFLDDDDRLASSYVDALVSGRQDVDVVVFQMRKGAMVLPWDRDVARQTFHKGRVGISFALNTLATVAAGTRFSPSRYEDFNLLASLRDKGATIHLSDAGPQYIVRP